MEVKVIQEVTCNRCGHSWYPRKAELPKSCANRKCGSPYWNKARVRPVKSK